MAIGCSVVSGQGLKRTASLPSPTNFSMCGWFYIRSLTGSTYQHLLGLDNAGDYCLLQFSPSSTFDLASGGGAVNFPSYPPLNTWIFMAVSCQGTGASDAKGYWRRINDAALVSATTAGRSWTTTTMGVLNNGFDLPTNGIADNIKAWDAVLSADEFMAESLKFEPLRWNGLHLWTPLYHLQDVQDWSGNEKVWTVNGAMTAEQPAPLLFGPAGRPAVGMAPVAASAPQVGLGSYADIVRALRPPVLGDDGRQFTATLPAAPQAPTQFQPRFSDIVPSRATMPFAALSASGMAAFVPPPALNVPSLDGWIGSIPDHVDPKKRPVDEGRIVYEAPPAPFFVPGFGFRGAFPDRVPGLARPVDEGRSTFEAARAPFEVTKFGWRGWYADRVDAPKRAVAEGRFTTEAPPAPGEVPKLGWRPTYPDRIDGLRRAVDEGMFVMQAPRAPSEVPAFGWKTEFPAIVYGPKRPVGEGSTAGVPFYQALLVPFLAWQPYAPDGAARPPARPVAEGLSQAEPPAPTAVTTPPETWQPRLVDPIWRPVVFPEGYEAKPHLPPPSTLVPANSWLPEQPDFVLGLARPAYFQEAFEPTAPSVAPLESWNGRYPDRIDAPKRVIDVGRPDGVPWPSSLLVPPSSSWFPRLVDPIWRPRLLLVEDYAAPLFPPASAVVPANAWQPQFPSWFPPLVLRQSAWSALPVAPPLAPLESWSPSFPALPPPTRREMGPFGAMPVAPPIAPLRSWAPTFPDWTLRVASLPVGWSGQPVQFQAAAPALTFWSPNFPDQLLAARRALEGWTTQAFLFTAPLGSWAPRYVDMVVPAPRTREGWSAVPHLPPQAPLVSWRSQYPDLIARAVPVLEGWATRPSQAPVAPLGSWSPTMPAFVLGKRWPLSTLGGGRTDPPPPPPPAPLGSWNPSFPAFLFRTHNGAPFTLLPVVGLPVRERFILARLETKGITTLRLLSRGATDIRIWRRGTKL